MKTLNIALAFPSSAREPQNEAMNADFLYQIEDIFDISQAQCCVSRSGYIIFGEIGEADFNDLSYYCHSKGIKVIRPSVVNQVLEKMYQPNPVLKFVEEG